jgi:hypothetical protein
MRRTGMALTLLLALSLSAIANGQSVSEAASSALPSYRISFERREAASGSGGSVALALPFECTSDGTIYVDFVNTVRANSGIEPLAFPETTLVSISPDGHSQTFRLDQAPKLYSSNMSFYAAESGVIFLVSGAIENKVVKGTSTGPDGSQHEFIRNDAERHAYVLGFGRDGTYRRRTEIEPSLFPVQRLGVFQTGTFLAYGYDWNRRSSRLALLKEDGTLLKELPIPVDDAPDPMLGAGRSSRAAQLIPHGRSILVLQNEKSPLLEVSESGAIRVIRPKLTKGLQIETVIPSDQDLYVILSPEGWGPSVAQRISEQSMPMYEISAEDGILLRRFELDDRTALGVACVHDRKFLSIDYRDGKVVPLVGTAEPVADRQRPVIPPTN